MPRVCTICSHSDRAAIDTALIGGFETNRDIANRTGLSRAALDRHRQAHIPAALAQANQAAEVVQADDLLGQVRTLLGDARRIQQAAEAAKDLKTALSGVREQSRILELLARLLGELEGSGTTVNVTLSQPTQDLGPEQLEAYSAQLAELAEQQRQEQRNARALVAPGVEVTQ